MKKPENVKKEEPKEERPSAIDDFTIDDATCTSSGAVFFNMTFNKVKVYGCRVVEGKNGDFISFPQKKVNEKYYNHVWIALNDDDTKCIIAHVEKFLEEKYKGGK